VPWPTGDVEICAGRSWGCWSRQTTD
jgi:hypothetical protein